VIESEAYRQAQEIRGKADAEAADIYAAAYNRDPDFYRFLKTMEVMRRRARANHDSGWSYSGAISPEARFPFSAARIRST
jgi:regulator of protease activity HflC (stomatin/prohibitin superfamily)